MKHRGTEITEDCAFFSVTSVPLCFNSTQGLANGAHRRAARLAIWCMPSSTTPATCWPATPPATGTRRRSYCVRLTPPPSGWGFPKPGRFAISWTPTAS